MTREVEGAYQLHVRLDTDHYQTVITELRLQPHPDAKLHGIRGRLEIPTGNPQHPTWHALPHPTARRQAATTLNHHLQHVSTQPVDQVLSVIAQIRGFTPTNTQPRRRQPRRDAQFELAIIAAAYASALHDPIPSQPRPGTLERLRQADRYYSPTTIGPLLTKARKAGYLTQTRRGKAGGRLTAKAQRTLDDAEFIAPW
jgi:hypothetical protein